MSSTGSYYGLKNKQVMPQLNNELTSSKRYEVVANGFFMAHNWLFAVHYGVCMAPNGSIMSNEALLFHYA